MNGGSAGVCRIHLSFLCLLELLSDSISAIPHTQAPASHSRAHTQTLATFPSPLHLSFLLCLASQTSTSAISVVGLDCLCYHGFTHSPVAFFVGHFTSELQIKYSKMHCPFSHHSSCSADIAIPIYTLMDIPLSRPSLDR